jgi:hypothetical protein
MVINCRGGTAPGDCTRLRDPAAMTDSNSGTVLVVEMAAWFVVIPRVATFEHVSSAGRFRVVRTALTRLACPDAAHPTLIRSTLTPLPPRWASSR